MKLQKLFLSVSAGCLLLGASGASMAVDCPTGIISYTTVPEIVITGQACAINDVVVEGKIEITGSARVSLKDVDSNGPVTITGNGFATIINLDNLQGDILVDGNDVAVLGASFARLGNITVSDNAAVAVQRNAANGDILCTGNIEVDAFGNRATGVEECNKVE